MPKKRINPIEKMSNCVALLKYINTDCYTMLLRVVIYLGYYAANKLGIDFVNSSVYRDYYNSMIGNQSIGMMMYDYRNSFCHADSLEELYEMFVLIFMDLPVFEDMDEEVKTAIHLLQGNVVGL